jgi:ParB/RepB/Spo0J family partition protein
MSPVAATENPKTRSAGAVRTDRLRPNTWNKARPLDAAFVASIKARGILSPLLVREMEEPDFKGRDLEIIAGERRWMAATELGLEYVPAVINNDANEADTLIENTHRVGLSPWQEAQVVGELLEKPGMDVETVAAVTGWSEGTVRRRKQLLELSPSWKKALEEGSLEAWTILHFEILAVFDEKRQEGLYKFLHYRANGMTVADLKEAIANTSRSLKSAPWDLDDVTLVPKVGGCTGCQKRSDCQADLFGEVKEINKAGGSCLDEDCFGGKLKAFTRRKAAELLEKHPEAIKVHDGWSSKKGSVRIHDTTEAKKGDKGAVPAIVEGEGGKVSLKYVKVKKTTQDKESPKAQAKEAERKRQAQIDAMAVEKLADIVRDPDTEFTEDAYAVLLQFCLVEGLNIEVDSEEEAVKRIRAYAKRPATLEEIWKAAEARLLSTLNRLKWSAERGWDEEDRQQLSLACWLVDADFDALLREAEAELAAKPAEATQGKDLEDLAADGDDPADLDDEE